MKRWIGYLTVVSSLVFTLTSCSSSPQSKREKHMKRGDDYVKEQKYKEAVLEYRNAVQAVPENPAAHWKLAQAALEAKDIRTAFPELRKTVELDPSNHEALGKLGEIYLLVGRTQEVSMIADNLVTTRPQDPQGYILQAGIAVRTGRIDDAIAKLRKASELDPKRIRTMLTIGNLHYLERDRKGAVEWYDKALSTEPDSVEVHVTRGNFFFATGDREEGEREYRIAIGLSKDKETVRIALAEHYFYQGRLEDGEKELTAIIGELNSQRARKVLAEIKLESGKVADAKPIVEGILKENPRDLDGKYLKGRIALAESRLGDAKALFEEVVKQDANMARARLYNGITEIRKGQIEAGRQEIEEAIRLDPANPRAQLIRGEISLRSGLPDVAEKAALEVLRRDPSNGGAAILLGDSYLARKDWKNAERVYGTMVRQAPKNSVGYLKMGVSRKMQGKPAEAAGFFAQALERSPGDMTVLNEYVFALVAAKNPEKAKKLLDERMKEEPGNPALKELAGRYYIATGKPAEAEGAFLKAIELSPDFIQPYYQLGVLYASQKKFPQAEARLRNVVEKDSRNVGALALFGLVLHSQGKIDAANQQYRKVLALSPKNALAANNLAANLADGGGNLDEALKFAQTAREMAPEDAAIADTLGWVYYRKGLADIAVPLLAEAAVKSQKNAAIRYHYGMALAKKGNKEEAAAELKAALALEPGFSGADEARKTLELLKAS